MKRMTLLLVLVLCLILAGCGKLYTPAQIDAIKQQSYQDGYDKGRETGFQEGRIEGHDEGHAEGYDIGKKDGYDEGYKKGYEDGKNGEIPPSTITYVANKNTMKFHKPDCGSVNDIDKANRLDWEGDRQGLIDKGYEPCKRCNP